MCGGSGGTSGSTAASSTTGRSAASRTLQAPAARRGRLGRRVQKPDLLDETHGLDDTARVRVLGGDAKRATRGLEPLGSLDEHAEARRVDEAVLRELDEHVLVASSGGILEDSLEMRCRREVDFAPNRDEARPICERLDGDRDGGSEVSVVRAVSRIAVW
jgi:hypothetical protein